MALQQHHVLHGAVRLLDNCLANHLRKEVGRHIFAGVFVIGIIFIPQRKDTDVNDELFLLSKRDSDWASNGGFAESRHRM